MALVESRVRSPLPGAGLDDVEAARRHRQGLANTQPEGTSRSVAHILRGNLLTRFNAILGALLVVVLVVGPIQDALFGIVLVTNALIGVVQELRAKRTLDRLALVSVPRARVVRSGVVRSLPVGDVVLGDTIEAQPGDQIVADGVVLAAHGLEVDESLLTGESEAVAKGEGSEVLSGSFVVAGTGRYGVSRVGADAYARRLADDARRFALVPSELRRGIDTILRLVTWVIVPAAVLLVLSQLAAGEGVADAVRGSVAGVGSMIPEGLVLLTSVAFAVGVVRLGRRRVLVQELAAIEGLARVDVVCVDKTGTLTEPELTMAALEPLGSSGNVAAAAGALAAADPAPNRSLRAIAATCPPPGWALGQLVPFSSARRWSAARFPGHGTWFLGAPDVLLERVADPGPARLVVDGHVAGGRRVLLLARAAGSWDGQGLPGVLDPAAVVVLEERIRPDAAGTLAYLRDQGVSVKVISGDDPRTVEAVVRRIGLAVDAPAVDGRDLPEDAAGLAAVVEGHTVFGRIAPAQKRAMVAALQSRGHVVAMTGDGVNDVLALKDADIGLAMGTGSEATRAVARLVLLDDSFATFPAIVAEGRRVIANVERVANLFVTKTVYAAALALAVGVARLPFPFYPRHLTIISSLTIGIPAFFLALAPAADRVRRGFVGRVLRFAVPAGLVAAGSTFAGYALAREEGVSLGEARTIATLVLFLVGGWVLTILARPLTPPRRLLIAAMVSAFLVIVALPATRDFFALEPPAPVVLLAAVGVGALGSAALEAGWQLSGWVQAHRHREDGHVTVP